MSKSKRRKKSGNKVTLLEKVLLITAILNLIDKLFDLIERFTR